MTNTAALNTSNKNTNNCGKLKYSLRTKRKQKNYCCLKLRNIQTQKSKTDANLNFQERERERGGGGGGGGELQNRFEQIKESDRRVNISLSIYI